jgi:uncharacterized membrane protein (DUF4010 family)
MAQFFTGDSSYAFIWGLLISTLIGLIIGMEREYSKSISASHTSGIRTFPLVAVSGFMTGFLGKEISIWIIIALLPSLMLFLAFDYYVKPPDKRKGLTSVFSVLLTFLAGILVAYGYSKEAIAVAVVLVTLLALKGHFSVFFQRFTSEELFAFVRLFIFSLLLVPFLPDKDFGSNGILNPSDIGWVVVIVSVLQFINYFLVKFIGYNKGILYSSLLGSMISSTSVSWVLATQSKKNPEMSSVYFTGILLASMVMLLRLFILVLIFCPDLSWYVGFPFSMICMAFMVLFFILRRKEKPQEDPFQGFSTKAPDIWNALVFGLVYVAILLFVYYTGYYFEQGGLLFSSIVSGLADTDAITVTLSRLPLAHSSPWYISVLILAAVLSNLCTKIFIGVFRGSAVLRKKMTVVFGIVILFGIVYIAIVLFGLWFT